MKKTAIIIGLAVLFTACGNNPENTGYSTPIDSSNTTGAAGATYGADNPAVAEPPKYEGATDSGLRANTMSHQDSVNAGLIK